MSSLATILPRGDLGVATIGELVLADRALDQRADVAQAVLGSPRLDLTTSQVSQLDVTIADPGWRLLPSRLFAPGVAVDFLDLALEVAAVSTGGGAGPETVELAVRSRGVQKLRHARGARVWRNLSATDWLRGEARAAGLAFVGEPTAVRPQVARPEPAAGTGTGDDETTWDVAERLAEELGFYLFEAAGTLYFGRPSWLIGQADKVVARYPAAHAGELEPLEVPVCRRSADAPETTVDLIVPRRWARSIRPGHALELAGVPTFDGTYLVTRVTFELDGFSPVSVTASTPIDPAPRPPSEDAPEGGEPDDDRRAGASYRSGSNADVPAERTGANARVEKMVSFALKQAGDRYVWGGNGPGGWDCSGLMTAAARQAGASLARQSMAALTQCRRAGTEIGVSTGIRTRGALLFRQKPINGITHIAMSLGDGRTIEARGRSVSPQVGIHPAHGRFDAAALVPGVSYR